MKRVFLFVTMLLLLAGAWVRADDQIQAVQQALKDQGFYYGDVDGEGGPETDAAIRRYQIRQGLEVTGKLDAQTLASLNVKADSKGDKNTIEAVPPPSSDSADAGTPAPAPRQTPPPSDVVQSDHDFLRRHTQAPTPPPAADDDATPPPAEPVEPPRQPEAEAPDAGQSLPPDYARFLRKTPYETAPPVVQRGTVQRAQERLAREGFYRGIVDGQLSDTFTRALAAYQREADLRITGRLDMDTLADMNLLPARHVVIRGPEPFYGPPPGAGRDVYRGIWVR